MASGDPLARLIDHTLLASGATATEIDVLCDDADELGVLAVCVNGRWTRRAVRRLETTPIEVCTVIDFPLGAGSTIAAIAQTRSAIDDGAAELDVVIPLGPLRSGADGDVLDHLTAIREAARGVVLKVIVESASLHDDELERACELVERSEADFVKTSTGFHPSGGATVHAVEVMQRCVGGRLGIKASGGIRTRTAAEAMVDAGATRLGTSATRAILSTRGPLPEP